MDCYITGTDTGAGKTWTTCAILRALSLQGLGAAAQKPIAAGVELFGKEEVNEDVVRLAASASVALRPQLLNPYLFRAPTAPHLAASIERRTISFAHIAAAFEEARSLTDTLLVEGVGGWCLPFGPDGMQSDLVARLQLPVLLVAGIRLGALNHTLLTIRALKADGVPLIGWLANNVDPLYPYAEATVEALAERIDAPCFGLVPWQAEENLSIPEPIERVAQVLSRARAADSLRN